jgi:hypothetical protein
MTAKLSRAGFSYGAAPVIAHMIAVILLCAPALWNGFPLMFDDVGGYLERWPTGTLGQGRSAVYGLLLWITRRGSFFPVVLLQAAVTVFVVGCALKIFLRRAGAMASGTATLPVPSPWLLPIVIAAVGLTSGVAFSVCKLIPDAWVAPAVLALHLLAWHRKSLTRAEGAVLFGVVVFAGASHMATFGVLAGLSVLYVIAWLVRRSLNLAPSGMVVAVAAVWAGLVLLLSVNAVVAGRFALTPGGEIFLLGRLVEDGMAREILSEECPRPDWELCAFQDALPDNLEAFVFAGDSSLNKIGGAHDPDVQREARSIIARSLVRHPLEHLERAVVLTARQFFDVGTGGVMEPLMSAHARWVLTLHAPTLVPGFDAARQQTGSIDLDPWSDWIVVPVSIVATLALPGLAAFLWRGGRRREALWPAMLFLALLGNAAICGVVIGSSDRYQARLVWLATLTGLVGTIRASRGYDEIPLGAAAT